jgi:hypothetical protein
MIKTLKKGRNNWRPWGIPWPLILPWFKAIKYTVNFDSSCWYNWLPDKDQDDINKGGGFTEMFSLNNASAYMWGWNPLASEKDVFRIWAYRNREDRTFEFVMLGTVKAGKDFDVEVKTDGTVVFLNGEAITQHKFPSPKFWFARMITEHFGGENNSEGPYGGVASQDMMKSVKKRLI